MNALFRLIVLLVSVSIVTSLIAGPQESKTLFIPLKQPIPVDRVPTPTLEELNRRTLSSTPNLTAYQQSARMSPKIEGVSESAYPLRFEGDPQIVIKDGWIQGWNIAYKAKSDPVAMDLRYVRFDRAFLVSDLGEKDILAEAWKKAKKIHPDYTTSRPIQLNIVEREGNRVVAGMWYIASGNPNVRYDRARNKFVTNVGNSAGNQALLKQFNVTEVPLPDLVLKRPELISTSLNVIETTVPYRTGPQRERLAVEGGDATVMEPFRVQGEWAQLIPVFDRNKNSSNYGKMAYLQVVSVTPGTPFAKGGLIPGDKITVYQGIKIAGKDPSDYDREVQSTPFGSKLVLDFIDSAGQRRRINVVAGPVIAVADASP